MILIVLKLELHLYITCFRDAMYGKMEAVCPFFAFYLLTDVAEEFLPGGILDVYLDVKSINWFRTSVAPQIEQFFWPSSASFKLTCLSETGTIDIEMLGMQKQVCVCIFVYVFSYIWYAFVYLYIYMCVFMCVFLCMFLFFVYLRIYLW